MMAQKNHRNKQTIVHDLPKKIVDLELLWRCISKIWRMNRIDQKEVHKRGNNKIRIIYIYIRDMIEFGMFILVSSSSLCY